MHIRNYSNNDKDRVLEIWYETSKIAHFFLHDELLQVQRNEIEEKYLPIAKTWIAEDDGMVCGFISLLDNYIGGLFIHPQCQGKGIGTALINKAKAERSVLTVGVYAKNQTARKFYERMGFSFVSEEIQGDTGEVVINMVLNK